MNLKFDWTINFPFLITAAAMLWGVFNVWLKQRDFNREILVLLGKRAPRDERSGLLGDVEDLKDQNVLYGEVLDNHQHALGLDRRYQQRRKPS